MNNFNYLDSIYNKKAKLYKNINIVKNVQICDLTLEADGEEMAGLKFKEAERIETVSYTHLTLPTNLCV